LAPDRRGELDASAALLQEKRLRYLLDRRLGGPQRRPGHSHEEEKRPIYYRESNSGRPDTVSVFLLFALLLSFADAFPAVQDVTDRWRVLVNTVTSLRAHKCPGI